MSNKRMRTKKLMIQRRRINGRAIGYDGCVCDLCQIAEGVHMHEVLNRARTTIRSREREATYEEPLCSILCEMCHSHAHNKHKRAILIWHNVDMYGMTEVIECLAVLSGSVKKDIMRILKTKRPIIYV